MAPDEIDAARARVIRRALRDLDADAERAMPRVLAELRAIDEAAAREHAAPRPAAEIEATEPDAARPPVTLVPVASKPAPRRRTTPKGSRS